MDQTRIGRFKALDAAFRARASRGDKLYARFAALATLNAPQDIETLIEQTFEARTAIDRGLGAWRSPGGPMRLVFAAALIASNRKSDDFFKMRKALLARRKERGARSLSHGGSCAALALVAAGGQPWQVDTFYDVLDAIADPWWKREAAREEMLAASMTVMGETAPDAAGHLSRARQALITAGVPKSHAEAAAFEVALTRIDPASLAGAWTSLNIAVRGRNELRHGIGQTGLAVLAAQGDGAAIADALVNAFDVLGQLKPKPDNQTAARLAMRLAQAQAGKARPIAAAGDLAAILAAQAAMVAAITAATTAAVVAGT